MRYFASLLLGASLLLIQSLQSSAQQESQLQKKNRELVSTWIALLNSHDTVKLEQLYDPQCMLRSPNWDGVVTGSREAKTVYARYFRSTPDLHHEITRVLATDSSAVIEYSSAGTFLHPEMGTPEYMRGKKYILDNCTVMDIREGKILHQSTYFDQVSFLRQMGFFDPR
jgi:steroid delta-isomerase-like uncharacterized protein